MRLVEIHKLNSKKSDETSKGLFFIFDFENVDFEGTTVIFSINYQQELVDFLLSLLVFTWHS